MFWARESTLFPYFTVAGTLPSRTQRLALPTGSCRQPCGLASSFWQPKPARWNTTRTCRWSFLSRSACEGERSLRRDSPWRAGMLQLCARMTREQQIFMILPSDRTEPAALLQLCQSPFVESSPAGCSDNPGDIAPALPCNSCNSAARDPLHHLPFTVFTTVNFM